MLVTDKQARVHRVNVAEILRPQSTDDVSAIVASSKANGQAVAVCGQRHSMGGQQFLEGGRLIDMGGLAYTREVDMRQGTVRVGAGVTWPSLIDDLNRQQEGLGHQWTIRQKQTGANKLSIGGAIAVNAHGRGLAMQPMVADIESLLVVGPDGRQRECNRTDNRELFELVVGGYGLVGIVTEVTLRLAPRLLVERRVSDSLAGDAVQAMQDAANRGAIYGDFQCVTDEGGADFMRDGILSLYYPVEGDHPTSAARVLTPESWLRIVGLGHTNKRVAWQHYRGHYLSTSGQRYWSGDMQLAPYVEEYPDTVLGAPGGPGGTDVITELYVPPEVLGEFMAEAATCIRRAGASMIYSTVRLIEPESETVLAWAARRWACVVLNLHVQHDPQSLARASDAFRALIDIAMSFGGSYFLTYHRFASPTQLIQCHPRIRDFVEKKLEVDPKGVFRSDWWHHITSQLREVGRE